MTLRPGQVYWNGKLGNRVVVYSVEPGITRVVLVLRRGYMTTARTFSWKHGIPSGYAMQYDPPKRREERAWNTQ